MQILITVQNIKYHNLWTFTYIQFKWIHLHRKSNIVFKGTSKFLANSKPFALKNAGTTIVYLSLSLIELILPRAI